MGRVTFQEFRLADLHTMSATARHGSEKFRVQIYPDSCHRGLKHTAFVLLMQRPPVLTIESMIAAVKVNVAKLMPTVVKQTGLMSYQYVSGCTAICGRRYPAALRHKVPFICVTFSSDDADPAAYPPIIPTVCAAYYCCSPSPLTHFIRFRLSQIMKCECSEYS